MPLLDNIKSYLSAPAHTVNSNYHVVAIALGLTVYMILSVLQPFGIAQCSSSKYVYLLGFGAITYVGSVIPTAIMHRIYQSEVAEGTFPNGKKIAAFLLSVLLIMIGNFLYFMVLNPDSPTISMLWAAVWQTLVIAVLIVGVYMTFDNARLHREIERIQQINASLSQNPTAQPEPEPAPQTICTPEKPSDSPINPDTLLYIESDKNYCKITTSDGTTTLRSTLTALENQLKPCGHIVRCHRAFLVNMQNVEGILGSASSGYKLKIKFHDATVPVSRTYIAGVLGYFEG